MTAKQATLAAAGIVASLILAPAALAGVPRTADSFGLSVGTGLSIGKAASDWCIGGRIAYTDLDGDGKTDLYCWSFRGSTSAALSNGATLVVAPYSREGACIAGRIGYADFNGDGLTDRHCETSGGVHQFSFASLTPQYGVYLQVADGWCVGGQVGYGDFNGDGKTDLHCRLGGNHWVGLSNGTAGYLTSAPVAAGWCAAGQIGYGDFNGDHVTDLHCRIGGNHWFGLSRLSANGAPLYLASTQVAWNWCAAGRIGYGDFNGDGKTDLHCQIGGNHWWGLARLSPNGTPSYLASVQVGAGWCAAGQIGYGDFDGDGKTDLHCEVAGGNHWWGLATTVNGAAGYLDSVAVAAGWCAAGRIGYGDFNGDGKTDLHCHEARWDEDLNANGANDSALEVVRCGPNLERSCLSVNSSLPGATRQLDLEPEPVTIHGLGAMGNHFGGGLSAVYAYYTRSSDPRPVLAVFDLDARRRVASVSAPANYTLGNTYFGLVAGPDGRKFPFLAPGAHYLVDSSVTWNHVCVFDPWVSAAGSACAAGFRKDETGDLAYQASFRHHGGWLDDADGDGWQDIHLPYLGGYIQTLSGRTGAELALTQINVSPGDPMPFHGGRNYASFETFLGVDGRKKVLVMAGNPVGNFPDFNCNVSRFVAVLDAGGAPRETHLQWSDYYSFIKNTFRGTRPPPASCPPNQCCPVPPEWLEVDRPGDLVDKCIHRFSDSLAHAGSEPITLYSYFTSDAPADTCLEEQRREWASCFWYRDQERYNRCATVNFLATTGYWTVQALRLSDGGGINLWSNAYAWGRVRNLLPGEGELFLIETFSVAKVRYDMEGYTPTALWVAKIRPDHQWQTFGPFPLPGRPKIERREPVEGALGATWGGVAEIVQRDVDGDGLRDVQLEDGTWVGYGSSAGGLVVKPDPN